MRRFRLSCLRNAFLLGVVLAGGALRAGAAESWQQLHARAERLTLQEAQSAALAGADRDGLYVLGVKYLCLFEAQKAKDIFAQLLAREASDQHARWGLAEALRFLHEDAESAVLLDQVVAAEPDFAPALISLGYVRYRAMDFDAALRYLVRVLKRGQEGAGKESYVRALCVYAGVKGMLAHYGGPLSKTLNGPAVLPALRKAERLSPQSPEVLFGLGSYYLLTPEVFGRDADKAREYLERARERAPLFADVCVRLAQVFLLKGDAGMFNKYLAEARSLDPQNELARDIESGACRFICVGKTGGSDAQHLSAEVAQE